MLSYLTTDNQNTNRKTLSNPKPRWLEYAIWSVFLIGIVLGALKRYAPLPEGAITLAYDGLCFGLLAFILVRRLRNSRHLPFTLPSIPLLFFCGYTLVTALNPQVSDLFRGILGWRFLSSSFLLFFIGYYAFDLPIQFERVMKVFWISAGIAALYGLIQAVRGYTAIELAWIEQLAATMKIAGTGRYRIMSTFTSAVDLTNYLTPALVTLFGYLVIPKNRTLPRIFLLFLLVSALFLTLVRAGWVAVFLGCLYVVLQVIWYKKGLRPVLPLIVMVGLLVVPILAGTATWLANQTNDAAFRERIGSLSNPLADASILDRLENWDTKWQIVRNNPLGIGVGMTGATSLRYENRSENAITTLDNSYLKILIETGWPGLFLFLGLVFMVLVSGDRITRRLPGDARIHSIVMNASFLSFLVLLFFGEYIELNPGRSIIWILVGMLFSLPRLFHNVMQARG